MRWFVIPAGNADLAVLTRFMARIPRGSDLEGPISEYMVEIWDGDEQTLLTAARNAQSETGERVMGQLAERLKAEGRTDGIAETLLHLLQRKFGQVPAEAQARVAQASTAELDAWVDKVIDAPTLRDVFDS